MRKRVLTGALVLVMLIVLVACGGKDDPSSKPSNSGGKNGGSADINIVDKPNSDISIVDTPVNTDPVENDPVEDEPDDTTYYAEQPTSNVSQYFYMDYSEGIFYFDTDLFGLSYLKFKDKIGVEDLMRPERWSYWGNKLEVVYLSDNRGEDYVCLFQNNKLVMVYHDSDSFSYTDVYNTYTGIHGDPSVTYDYWSGYNLCEWQYYDHSFEMFVETYDDVEHLRQRYTSYSYIGEASDEQ